MTKKPQALKIIRNPKLPITEPGIYAGIPIEEYHGPNITDGPSVSSSSLKLLWDKSPAHFFSEWKSGNPAAATIEDEDEEARKSRSQAERAKLLGAAAHHLVLGEDNFSTLYIGQPLEYTNEAGEIKPWNNNANVCKKFHAEQNKAGRRVVLQRDLKKIVEMARSLAAEPIVQNDGLAGYVECSLIVKDAETGLWLRSRPDVIPTDSGDFVDLKTSVDVSDLGIFRALGRFGYHFQAGMLWECCEQLGVPFLSHTLMFVETVKPFCARPVPLEDEDIARGRQQVRHCLRQVALCLDRGIWPGPGGGEMRKMPLPLREREAIDARLKFEGGEA